MKISLIIKQIWSYFWEIWAKKLYNKTVSPVLDFSQSIVNVASHFRPLSASSLNTSSWYFKVSRVRIFRFDLICNLTKYSSLILAGSGESANFISYGTCQSKNITFGHLSSIKGSAKNLNLLKIKVSLSHLFSSFFAGPLVPLRQPKVMFYSGRFQKR